MFFLHICTVCIVGIGNYCHTIMCIVLDPERGVCADPVGRDAIFGVGGPGPPVGAGERQLSLDRRGEMFGSKEDDPITTSMNDHAQSKCQRAWPVTSVNTIVALCSMYYCFRKINHLVTIPFAFIL